MKIEIRLLRIEKQLRTIYNTIYARRVRRKDTYEKLRDRALVNMRLLNKRIPKHQNMLVRLVHFFKNYERGLRPIYLTPKEKLRLLWLIRYKR